MSQLSLSGWRKKAPSRVEQLRSLLADGRWHSQTTLQKVAGFRFGARLFDLHNEFDVGAGRFPVHYAKRTDAIDDSRVSYRQVDKASCDICSDPKHMRPSERIARLEKENTELRCEVARLRGLLR